MFTNKLLLKIQTLNLNVIKLNFLILFVKNEIRISKEVPTLL